MEADGAVDAQNAPTVPWKTLCVFHELPQGLSNQITHEKPRKAPKWRWETRIEPISSGLLPVGTVLMSSRAPVGYLAIAGVPTAINQGFIAMICDGPLPPIFVLNWVSSSMEAIKARASGTTFPEISKRNFRTLTAVKPTGDVIVAYQRAAEPLFDLLTARVKENVCLAKIRDYILPRLLSGQVRVEVANG